MTDDMIELPDGRQAQVWHGGVPSGPLVIFLHGTPGSRLTAATGDAAAVRSGVHLVAVNRPGYGRSDPAESGLASVADDTVAVADSLGTYRFAALGAFGGGPYALACAARHPDRAAALGVVAGPAVAAGLADGDDEAAVTELSAAARAMAAQILVDDDDELVQRWLATLAPADAEILQTLPPVELAKGVRESLRGPVGLVRDSLAVAGEWDLRLDDVTSPTWLWWAGADATGDPRSGSWLAEHLPDATLVVKQDTGQLGTLLLHWDEILATLRDALGGR